MIQWIEGKKILVVTDCDKSFCNVCYEKTCAFDFFKRKNPEKAELLLKEIFRFEKKRKPELNEDFWKKQNMIETVINLCSGHDDKYDFLFRDDELVSIQADRRIT
ncbi:MAG: hypothetical protein JW969_11595 [Spirochaetales bacterium]|nr:hypothetical protein [Spirochaetales bacterium]